MVNHQEYKRKQEKRSHKKLIITLTTIVLVIVLSAFIYFLVQKYNAKGQIDKFEKAVKDNDYNTVSKVMSNNSHNFTEVEAKNFVRYVKKNDNYNKFQSELKGIKKKIREDNPDYSNLGSFTDSNDKKILTVNKDGKKFLILDNIAFKPYLYSVYVKELDNKAVYEYKLDKNIRTIADKNKLSKIGEFFVGNYSIDAQKTFKDSEVNGKTNGQLIINTDKKNKKGQVVADDVFSQVSFKTKLQDEKELDKDSFKLYINNNETDYNKNKVYGKYPYTENPISVYAVGKIDDKEFRTNTVKLKENPNQDIQNVKLEFDKAKVHRYKYDTDDKKDKSKDFMKKYMKHLNKAYSKGDYDYIKNDIDKGSDLAKRIKKETKHKQKIEYKIKSFDKIERNGNKLNIKLTKSNNDYTTKATYTLKFDYKDQFKITEYKD